jgi:hypothetical protein
MHIINLRKAIGLTSIAITDIQVPEAEGGMDGRSVPPSVVTVRRQFIGRAQSAKCTK